MNTQGKQSTCGGKASRCKMLALQYFAVVYALGSKQPCIMVSKGKGCSWGLATSHEIQKATGICFEYIYVIK